MLPLIPQLSSQCSSGLLVLGKDVVAIVETYVYL